VRDRIRLVAAVASAAVVIGGAIATGTLTEPLAGRQVFPVTNWWNLDISAAPVDGGSESFIDFVSGRTLANPSAVRRMHPDFGPPPYGIPYVVVPGTQSAVPVHFVDYPEQSDAGAPGRPGYPIPDEARTMPNYIEGGVAGGGTSGDRHLIVIDRDRWLLYETWSARWNAARSRWDAGSGAVFDLADNLRRPDGWTSADAAGLAIFPGLVRYDEAYGSDEIRHAFRVTVRATNGYVWPASHAAGSTAGALPMGARLRLKPRSLSGYPAPIARIFRAMQTYGLIVADNGSDLYVSGTMDGRWNNDVLNPAFGSLTVDDFEVIALGWGRDMSPSPPPTPAASSVRLEFEGDGVTDVSVYRPATGQWFVLRSSTGFSSALPTTVFGAPGDVPVRGDFDGDGMRDLAIYRPTTGTWCWLKSSSGNTSYDAAGWGVQAQGDVPAPGDYDGDGRTDPTIYRPASGTWFVLRSSTNYTASVAYGWGGAAFTPVPGDYDGDGRTDVAVYRPTTGQWLVLPSASGYATGWPPITFGQAGDVPVNGDFDGDGRKDLAVFRPSNGTWFWLKSSTNNTTFDFKGWGVQALGDMPVPGDYDGDGKTDPTVYRPAFGTWFVLKSSTDYMASGAYGWGSPTDVPLGGQR
jgi:hypothetical protein